MATLIQLVEHFIWKNIDNYEWNHFFSCCGLLVLLIEPIASMFLMDAGKLRNSFLVSYLLFILLLSIYYPWKPYTKIADNRHLLWVWQHPSTPYAAYIIWVCFFIIPLLLTKYYMIGVLGIITVILSIITWGLHGTWGSMWCWIANGAWLLVIGFIAADKCFEDMCKKIQ